MHMLDLNHTEAESEIQGSKFVRCDGSQATSCVDTNIVYE
jgi:hypothetical protein